MLYNLPPQQNNGVEPETNPTNGVTQEQMSKYKEEYNKLEKELDEIRRSGNGTLSQERAIVNSMDDLIAKSFGLNSAEDMNRILGNQT